MDFISPEVMYGIIAGVATCVLIVASLFASKETTFEEAVLNKKRDPILQELLQSSSKSSKNKSGIVSSTKDDQKKKNNLSGKQSKKRSSVGRSHPRNIPVVSVEPPSPQTDVVDTVGIHDHEEEVAEAEDIQPSASPKHEGHVEFKVANEVINLDEELEEKLSKRKVEENRKPKKPILTNKGEFHVNNNKKSKEEEPLVNKPSRGNSFDVVHPKDDYELMKSKDPASPNCRSKSPVHFNGFPEGETTSAPVVVGDVKKKDHKKTQKASVPKQLSQEVFEGMTPAKLVEVVKCLALNDQEVQILVNELLNRDCTGETSWSNKYDPTAVLKKSLTETEAALKIEKSNLESTMIRVRELREELASEKKMTVSAQHHSRRLEQELSRSNAVILQLKNDLTSLNANFQSKKSEEVAALNRLNDENRKLKDIINKFDGERSNLDAIPLMKSELEQLRMERHQANSTLKQLTEENHALKDHMKQLSNSREHEEHALRQQITELTRQLNEKDHASSITSNELQVVNAKLVVLESQHQLKVKDLENNLNEARTNLNGAKDQIEQLVNEKSRLSESLQSMEERDGEVSHLKTTVEEKENEINRLQSLLKESSDSFYKIQEEMKVLQENTVPKQQFDQKEHELTSSLSSLNSQLSSIVSLISKFLPETTSTNVVASLEELLSSLQNQTSSSSDTSSEQQSLQSQLHDQKEANKKLEQDIESFKSSLKLTDDALKQIEQKAREEQSVWSQQLNQSEEKTRQLEKDNSRLREERKTLESTIKELQSLQETFVDMEEKLKDLQLKLQGEDAAKRELTLKYDELSSELISVKDELNQKQGLMDQFSKEKLQIEKLKSDLEEAKEQLDKDRKSLKEMTSLNVKLKALVKIGEDSLRDEMKKSEELSSLLKLRNGSAVSTPCLMTNNSSNGSDPNVSSSKLTTVASTHSLSPESNSSSHKSNRGS